MRSTAPRLVWNFDNTSPMILPSSVIPKYTSSWKSALPRKAEGRNKLTKGKVTGATGATHTERRSPGKRISKGK